jgi:alkanesulfonate monooxygenase
MGIKILWYVSGPDGSVPWEQKASWTNSYEQYKAQVENIDELGFYGALLATDQHEAITLTATLAPLTKRMKFLTALHPGLVSPTKLAQMALTIDKFNQGRLLFNAVNGNDQGLSGFGMHIPHDERYEFSYEYWDSFRQLYYGSNSGYEGKYIKLAPRVSMPGRGPIPPAKNPFPLWGAGTSEPGIEYSSKILDWYLSFADTPPKLGDKFRRVGAKAEEKGRKLKFGTRLQIIVRDTEQEAWAHAQWLLDQTSIETAIRLASRQFGPEGLNKEIESDDPKLLRRIEALRAGKMPDVRDLEVYPNIWVGPSPFGFDVLFPWAGTWIVGSTENVAARLKEFYAQGTEAFIISGWPLISEGQRIAKTLLPLLELDHEFELPEYIPEKHTHRLSAVPDYVWPEDEAKFSG